MLAPLLSMLDDVMADLVFLESCSPVYRFEIFNPAVSDYETWTWGPADGFQPGAPRPATCAVRIGPEALSDIFQGKIGRELLTSGRVAIGGLTSDATALASLFVDDAERQALDRVRLSQPSTRKKVHLAARAEAILAEVTRDGAALERVRGMLARWVEHRLDHIRMNQTVMAFFPDLDAPPWLDPAELGVESILREGFPALREEAQKFVDGRVVAPHHSQPLSSPDEPAPGKPPGWRSWNMVINFDWLPDRQTAEFPISRRVLEAVRERCTVIHAGFLIMEPGVSLPVHSDGSHWAVTNLFGLIVPEGSHLTVDGERRANQEGRSLLFNDSYYHSAANESRQPRVVFSITAASPSLTPVERTCLERICRIFPRNAIVEYDDHHDADA
jgi:hypothetical protein